MVPVFFDTLAMVSVCLLAPVSVHTFGVPLSVCLEMARLWLLSYKGYSLIGANNTLASVRMTQAQETKNWHFSRKMWNPGNHMDWESYGKSKSFLFL